MFPVPGWPVIVATVAVAWLGGLGTTLAYHRSLAHTSVRLHPVVRHILIFFAMFNGSGSPDSWTANHRQHHSRVETRDDISSPGSALLGGPTCAGSGRPATFRSTAGARTSQPQYASGAGCDRDPLLRPLWRPAFGWRPLLVRPDAPRDLTARQCFVNSNAHLREGAKTASDSSQNITWLGFLQFFQGRTFMRITTPNPLPPSRLDLLAIDSAGT